MSRAFTFTLLFLLSAEFLYGAMEEVGPNSLTDPTATISVDPSINKAEVNQTFMVNVAISDVIDLYGWEFKLGWNSTLLEAINVTEGTFLKGYKETLFVSKINNTLGYMLVDCSLVGDVPGVSGNGILATVEFYVKTWGECILNLYDTKLVSSLEQSITHTAIDGTVRTIKSPIAYFTYSPEEPCVDEIVTFNASASTADGGNIICYKWDFGDSNVTMISDPIITHVYPSQGAYNITLTITDSEGLTNSTWQLVGIGVLLPHDVRITKVTPSKSAVGQGYPMNIDVTVENKGEYAEFFNVTGYANATTIQTEAIALASGNSTTIVLTWDTAGFAEYQNYTISAYAHPVPGETYVMDNTLVDGFVLIVHPGDVNADGKVRVDDLLAVATAFGSEPGMTKWDPTCDINCDLKIRVDDVLAAALNFGYTKP